MESQYTENPHREKSTGKKEKQKKESETDKRKRALQLHDHTNTVPVVRRLYTSFDKSFCHEAARRSMLKPLAGPCSLLFSLQNLTHICIFQNGLVHSLRLLLYEFIYLSIFHLRSSVLPIRYTLKQLIGLNRSYCPLLHRTLSGSPYCCQLGNQEIQNQAVLGLKLRSLADNVQAFVCYALDICLTVCII